jgi:cytochrome P450
VNQLDEQGASRFEFTLEDDDIVANPFPAFRRLREEDPVHWSGYLNGWVLTRYDDVRDALWLSVDRIAPFLEHLTRKSVNVYGELRNIGLWTTFNDAPAHTHLRRLLGKVLTTGYIAAAQPMVEATARGLFERIGERSELDLMEEVALWLPISVIASLLGVPPADVAELRQWTEELNLFVGAAKKHPDKYRVAAHGIGEMSGYYREHLAQRRRRPTGDLISRLALASEDGDTLTDDEIVALCVNLTHAGHVTTGHLIGNGMLALLNHPDQLALLRREPELMPSAVEEMLRYDGPVQAMVRVASRALPLHGTTIEPGQRIFPMLNAANRDGRAFPEPERFDIRRQDNRHIVFGHGPHTCAGMALARIEIPAAFGALFERYETVELMEPVRWVDSVAFRGPTRLRLHVR